MTCCNRIIIIARLFRTIHFHLAHCFENYFSSLQFQMLQDMEIIAKRLPASFAAENGDRQPRDSSDNAATVAQQQQQQSSPLVSDAGKTFLEQLLASYAVNLSSGDQSNIDSAISENIAGDIEKQVESGCQKATQILRAVVTEVQAEKTRNDTLMKQINEDSTLSREMRDRFALVFIISFFSSSWLTPNIISDPPCIIHSGIQKERTDTDAHQGG